MAKGTHTQLEGDYYLQRAELISTQAKGMAKAKPWEDSEEVREWDGEKEGKGRNHIWIW